MLYDFLRWHVAAPVVRHVLRPTVVGLERLSEPGAAVVAGNHTSSGDTFPVTILLRRRMYFPAKKAFFEAKDFKGRLLAWVLRFAHQVPIDTGGGKAGRDTLAVLTGHLRKGELVGIFPEGTRSPDGRMYRFHTGVARLALAAGVPVLPLACVNTKLRRGFLGIPTMKNAVLTIGEPLHFDQYFGRQDDAKVLRYVTNQIAAVIQQMTGQAYVDVYAHRVKSGELTIDQADAYIRDSPPLTPPPDDPAERIE